MELQVLRKTSRSVTIRISVTTTERNFLSVHGYLSYPVYPDIIGLGHFEVGDLITSEGMEIIASVSQLHMPGDILRLLTDTCQALNFRFAAYERDYPLCKWQSPTHP